MTLSTRALQNNKAKGARFWSRVLLGDGCWEWQGFVGKNGYGQAADPFRPGKIASTHRTSWALTYGPIPDGLCVLHRCDNRRCVRPDHLFLGTIADNTRDMDAKGRRVQVYGLDQGAGRLTPAEVKEIRRRYVPPAKVGRGWKSNAAELALEFGVTPQYVSQLARKVWRTFDAD